MKSVNLLSFQKDLNEQFMEIFHDKQMGIHESDYLEDQLGLTFYFKNIEFFISINQLKKISMKNDFEQIVKTKSWLFGFNQEAGQIYTIFNLEKILLHMIDQYSDFDAFLVNDATRILYLKSFNEQHNAILVNHIELNYSQQYEKILSVQKNKWTLSDKNAQKSLNILELIAKNNMTLSAILKDFQKDKMILQDSFSYLKANVRDVNFLSLCIKDVYLKQEKNKQEVVFSLDITKVIEYMMDENAYE